MTEILKLNNICVSYGSLSVLKNISLSINSGEVVFIMGENGSGKSTLMKVIAGLIRISSGSLIRNAKISYVPQIESADRNFPATVYEIILTGLQRPKKLFYDLDDKNNANEIINILGLNDLRDREIKNLSGGQFQRVLLARALCGKPELLLLDEPCAGLDVETHKNFYDTLKKLNLNGTAIIIVTHDESDLNEINYNKLIKISDGRILN